MLQDLVQWLGEQLDTDAAELANPCEAKSWHTRTCESLPDVLYPDRETGPCDCDAPAQVLRYIAADRALIDDYVSAQETVDVSGHPDMLDVGRAQGLEEAVLRRASAYEHRPGYREEWRS